MIPRLADLLDGALKGAGLESTSVIWQIAERWNEIVGPRIAERAAPVRLRKGELTLSAPDAVWRQELTLLGPEITERVNRNIGDKTVTRVRLISGPLRSPEPSRRRRRIRSKAPREDAEAAIPTPRRPLAPPSSPVAAALESLAGTRADRLESDRRALARHHADPYGRSRRR